MSTIRRIFFRGVVPSRSSIRTAIDVRERRRRHRRIAAIFFFVFAKHIKKGICESRRAHRHGACDARHAIGDGRESTVEGSLGGHHAPTTGRSIWRRTSRFARKLRKLFPPSPVAAGRRRCTGRDPSTMRCCRRRRARTARMRGVQASAWPACRHRIANAAKRDLRGAPASLAKTPAPETTMPARLPGRHRGLDRRWRGRVQWSSSSSNSA